MTGPVGLHVWVLAFLSHLCSALHFGPRVWDPQSDQPPRFAWDGGSSWDVRLQFSPGKLGGVGGLM